MPEPLFEPDPPAAPDVFSSGAGAVQFPGTMASFVPTQKPKAEQPKPQSLDDLTAKVSAEEAGLLKEKIGAEGGMTAAQERRDAQYRARMDHEIAAESATAQDLKPWNAGEELAKRQTSLWDQFGSPGFVVAMIGSAFTAMPMNSALNAGAAAMNAINQGNMDNYNKSFDAWKENTRLVEKRLDLEERQFNQIDKLRSSDMESWRAQATSLLNRFNDRRKLLMLENGMDDEVQASLRSQFETKAAISDARERIEKNETRRQLTMVLAGDKPTPQKLAQAAVDAEDIMSGGARTPEALVIRNLISQPGFRDQPVAEQNKQIQDAVAGISSARYGGRSGGTPLELQKQLDASDASADPNETPEDTRDRHNRISSDFYRAKNPIGADRNRITQEHNQIMADLTSRKIDVTEAKNQEDALHKRNMDDIASGRLKNQMTAEEEKERHDKALEEIQKNKMSAGNITPNKRADLTEKETRYKVVDETLDEVINAMQKNGGAGLKGKVLRLDEILQNIFGGSNSTKYVEIRRKIELARTMTPRLLQGSSSRPVAAETDRMNAIVPGLETGDTWQNTLAGLKELKRVLGEEHATVKQILGTPESAAPVTAPEPAQWPGVPVN